MVVAQLTVTVTQEDKRNVQVLCGFLNALWERNPELSNRLLDDALEDAALATFIPVLQIVVGVDDRGLGRLKRALTHGNGSIEAFRHLAWGRPLELISAADFRELVLAIAAKPSGLDVAVEILAMRLDSDKRENRSHDCEVIEAGRALMRQLSIKNGRQRDVYNLSEIVTACLRGPDGASIAQDVCRKLKHAVSKNETHAFDNSQLIQSLLKVQPAAVLDALFGDNKSERQEGVRIIETIGHLDANPFDAVQESDVFEWCDRDPPNRYPTIASVITFFRRTDEKAPLQWTDTALRLLEKAPDRVAVLKEFVRRFRPMIWSGSRAAIVESRAKLLDELEGILTREL